MLNRVQAIRDYHETRVFGSSEHMLARQRETRLAYHSLTDEEIADLVSFSVSRIDAGNDRFDSVLLCLACFRPGSLRPFHNLLTEHRILYPAVLFHGASPSISRRLIELLNKEGRDNHILCALAWIADEVVQSAFALWRREPPTWAASLHIPPHSYAEEAGWELTPGGNRRNLFTETAYPLVRPSEVPASLDSVRIGIESDEHCPWCRRALTVLFQFENARAVLPADTPEKLSVLTCDVCTCYGPIFSRNHRDGSTGWHPSNTKPSYLPPDSSGWDQFPAAPLVMSGESRHFLEAANWLLPGVAFSQAGGHPTWVQDAEYPFCPDCSRKMLFIGQISNEDYDEHAEGIYYAFLCAHCEVAATRYQQS